MSIELIMNQIEKERPNLKRDEVRAVATDIYYSGEPASEIIASDSIVDKLVSGYQSRQTATANRVSAEDPHNCPICKLPLKPVTLIHDRKAVMCAKHFVVYPIKPEVVKDDEGDE